MLLRFSPAAAHSATHASGASDALSPSQIGAALASHSHLAQDITDTIPITKGGTGSTSVNGARKNLQVEITQPAAIFASGWADYGSGWELEIYKFQALVLIHGLVKRVSGSSNLIATLSIDRPLVNQMCVGWGYWSGQYNLCRVDVNKSGNILLQHPTTAPSAIDFLNLNMIYRSTSGGS